MLHSYICPGGAVFMYIHGYSPPRLPPKEEKLLAIVQTFKPTFWRLMADYSKNKKKSPVERGKGGGFSFSTRRKHKNIALVYYQSSENWKRRNGIEKKKERLSIRTALMILDGEEKTSHYIYIYIIFFRHLRVSKSGLCLYL